MNRDIHTHYNGMFPDKHFWPEPVPNGPFPEMFESPNPFTYTFCWHAEAAFSVWHRALTLEFERELQTFDPANGGHCGYQALGLHYWAWEHWDGETLPLLFSQEIYTMRTDKWEDKGYPKGFTFPNPLFRWFAPVCVKDQMEEFFPQALTDANCTSRSISFRDPSIPNTLVWNIKSREGSPSIPEVVNTALQQVKFLQFGTVNKAGGSQYSIENAHNKFHNHIGGLTMGGLFGPGRQKLMDNHKDLQNVFPDGFTGTMAQNQSIFDPIFWAHHSNVERQLCSWQKIHPGCFTNGDPSRPPDECLNLVLYPWTTPEKVAAGEVSWNTKVGEGNDGTFQVWFDAKLSYEYEEDLIPPTSSSAPTGQVMLRVDTDNKMPSTEQRKRLIGTLDHPVFGGEYQVVGTQTGIMIASISLLSAIGSGCARCQQREPTVNFDVSHVPQDVLDDYIASNNLVLTRNGRSLEGVLWTVETIDKL
jgi:hypothetical protein